MAGFVTGVPLGTQLIASRQPKKLFAGAGVEDANAPSTFVPAMLIYSTRLAQNVFQSAVRGSGQDADNSPAIYRWDERN